MTDAGASSALEELGAAIGVSAVGRVTGAAARAFESRTPPREVIRAAARAGASHYDGLSGTAPRGLAILGAAANLLPAMQPRFHPLPVLQAIAYLASEANAAVPAKAPLVVSGEVTHLARPFLFAVREGDLAEAESIFLGMVSERGERKMAGDMLFRAAIEDMGEGGRKLMIAVKSWQLARSLGFKDARLLLRPAVVYLVRGPRDREPFESLLGFLGKEWVDLERLGSGGRPLDDAGRAKVALILTAGVPACISSTLALLTDGYAAASIAEGFAIDAAKRVIAADGYDVEAAKALMFAHAARFVLTFSRTSERLYALFQAALRARSPEPNVSLAEVLPAPTEGDELCHLAGNFDARKPLEAAARVHAYVVRGYSGPRLLDVLANYASRDSALANNGVNLLLADVCATEYLATRAAEFPTALSKMIAASPKDQAAYESWSPLLGP